MALNVYSQQVFSFGAGLRSITRFLDQMFHPAPYSPEENLMNAPHIDPRLKPRVAMSNEHIDVGLLAELGQMGLRHGKLITEQSHPELMAAWNHMSVRAGLKRSPQLILVDNPAINAMVVSPNEAVITTGAFKHLDLRENIAVLGHELGHARNDHHGPRYAAAVAFGGAGALVGNALGRHVTIGHSLSKWFGNIAPVKSVGAWLDKSPPVKATLDYVFNRGKAAKPNSLLVAGGMLAGGAALGLAVANNLTVRPTELQADMEGAVISGDPDGLANALEKMRHLEPTELLGKINYKASGYPTLDERISRLREAAAGIKGTHAPVYDQIPNDQPQATVSQVSQAERVSPEAQQFATI